MYTKQLILIAATLASHLASASCIHGTSLHKRVEGPGGTVEVSDFGYTGLLGPLNWAGISPENSACATSTVQSPINIDKTILLATEAPVIAIQSVKAAEFENLGTTVEVIVNGTTTFAGTEFALRQFHFHTPSEHRIAEEYFPLEVHMVHEAAGTFYFLRDMQNALWKLICHFYRRFRCYCGYCNDFPALGGWNDH